MIKILIADDHSVVRKKLADILTDEIQAVLRGIATPRQEAIEEAERRDWALVMMDNTMPGWSGLDALKEIQHARPNLRALVLSIHPEAQYGQRAAMAGASGYRNRVSDAHRPSGASSPLCRIKHDNTKRAISTGNTLFPALV